jgi:hypothetical protein
MTSRGNNVRTHTRRTASGATTTVRQHSRKGRGRKGPLLSPRHALKLAVRAFKAGRRRRRWLAAGLGALAVAEIVVWASLQGVTLIAATAGVLALAVAVIAGSLTGVQAPAWGQGGRSGSRTRRRSGWRS